MLIIEHNDKQLLETLLTAKRKGDLISCIHLPFSTEATALDQNVLAKAISLHFSDPDGSIFICDDRDVFLLANGINSTQFTNFKIYLIRILPDQLRSVVEKTARYTWDKKWDDVIDAVKAKIDIANQKKQQELQNQEALEKQKRTKEIALALNSTELNATISARRSARQSVEVLFAEDDPFQRRIIRMALSSNSSVSSASDGLSCLESYASIAPDILFLDIGLPDISGHEILKKILAVDPQAYIVMLSANGDRENVMQAIQAGAKGFVAKPFTQEKLFHHLSTCSSKSVTPRTGILL